MKTGMTTQGHTAGLTELAGRPGNEAQEANIRDVLIRVAALPYFKNAKIEKLVRDAKSILDDMDAEDSPCPVR